MPTKNIPQTFLLLLSLGLCFTLSGQRTFQLRVIKGTCGIPIDSISVASTFPANAQGVSFRGDSVSLKLLIYAPSDKIFLQTFSQGNSLGNLECWVDEKEARVFLSVDAGSSQIDSIRGSSIDYWYLSVMGELNAAEDPTKASVFYDLLDLVATYGNELISAPYARAIIELWPNDYQKMVSLREALYYQPSWLKNHPYYAPILARLNLVAYNKNIRLKDLKLIDRGGKPVEKPIPQTPYSVLYFWSLNSPSADLDHQRMAAERQAEVFPKGVPFIGICSPADQATWNNYLRDRNIPWINYMELTDENNELNSDRLGILVYPTYFLLNRRGRVMGIYDSYDDLRKVLETVAASPKKN
jgi:hypothetical protein